MRLAFVLLLLWAVPAEATTYYVRLDGANGPTCNGTVNVADSAPVRPNCAWASPNYASDNVAAGDTIRVQEGHYGETVSPSDSGTSGNTVTMVADGVVTVCKILFTGQSYIRIVGLTVDGSLSGCTLADSRIAFGAASTGLEFWNVSINEGNFGFNMGTNACTKCIIVGGTITGVNNGGYGIVSTGNDMFVGYVAMNDIDYLGVAHAGLRGRFVNMKFSGFLQIGIRHPDFFFPQGSTANTLGYSGNLIESSYGIGTPDSNDNKVMHISNATGIDWEDNVWRFGVSYNMGSGFYSVYSATSDVGCIPESCKITRFHFYNDTTVGCSRATLGANVCGNFDGSNDPPIIASARNELFSDAWSTNVSSNIHVVNRTDTTFDFDYNFADDSTETVAFSTLWTNQANETSNVDPGFVNPASDWTLQASSGARGAGGHLTTATSCNGTTLNVASGTGSMFIGDNSANLSQYGGALVPGDFLHLNGVTYQVVSRSADALTLSASVTCSNGDLVYFGTSSTVDPGAYPYKAGGYELTATYSGTTVTPNDTSLVRFVACFNDDVPYEVDNTSPYTCSAPSGTFSARAYPRYASATLFAEATESMGGVRVRRKPE